MADTNWHSVVAIALAAATAPWIVKSVGKFWGAVERYDERRDEKARIKKEAKDARKLAKLSPHYTSATVVPPPRLGHERGSDSGSGEST